MSPRFHPAGRVVRELTGIADFGHWTSHAALDAAKRGSISDRSYLAALSVRPVACNFAVRSEGLWRSRTTGSGTGRLCTSAARSFAQLPMSTYAIRLLTGFPRCGETVLLARSEKSSKVNQSMAGRIDFPEPFSWSARAAAMSWLPGPVEQCLPRLRFLLLEIRRQSALDSVFRWPDDGHGTTVRAASRGLARSGLIKRGDRPGLVGLTEEANRWLGEGEDTYLIALAHANIRFLGELLSEIDERTTHEDLRAAAEHKYQLSWRTLDQVHRRTLWLRAGGFVELWPNNDLVLTEAGAALRDELSVVKPEDLPHAHFNEDEVVNLAAPPSRIGERLSQLDDPALHNRRRAISYVPGGDIVGIIQELVSAADPATTRNEFVIFCARRFGIAKASAEAALSTLRAGGLIDQTGPDSFSASSLAVEWVESDDPIDLVRIMHCHYVGVGETLEALEHAERSGEVAQWLEHHYDIPVLTTTEVARRLRLLEAAGLVGRITQFTYKLNPLGRAVYRSLPLLRAVGGGETSEAGAFEAGSAHNQKDHEAHRESQELAQELREAALDASHYVRLERAAAAALQFLGLDAEHVGGPGNTDVLVTVWLSPTDTRRVIVDAKASAGGSVEERSINWEVLEDHKAAHRASGIAVIGPAFVGRSDQWAAKHNAVLITTDELAEWLVRHGQVPVSREKIFALFDRVESGVLADAWESVVHTQRVFADVATQLWRAAHDPVHVTATGGALTRRDLWMMMMKEGSGGAELPEIDWALQLLSSHLVEGAVQGQPGYVARESPELIAARLRSIARELEMMGAQVPSRPNPEPGDDRKRSSPTVRSLGPRPADVRAWARAQERHIPRRGRLPGDLVAQYESWLSGNEGTSSAGDPAQ